MWLLSAGLSLLVILSTLFLPLAVGGQQAGKVYRVGLLDYSAPRAPGPAISPSSSPPSSS
jgi:hypothetical protein